jgi:hypothetical protein
MTIQDAYTVAHFDKGARPVPSVQCGLGWWATILREVRKNFMMNQAFGPVGDLPEGPGLSDSGPSSHSAVGRNDLPQLSRLHYRLGLDHRLGLDLSGTRTFW